MHRCRHLVIEDDILLHLPQFFEPKVVLFAEVAASFKFITLPDLEILEDVLGVIFIIYHVHYQILKVYISFVITWCFHFIHDTFDFFLKPRFGELIVIKLLDMYEEPTNPRPVQLFYDFFISLFLIFVNIRNLVSLHQLIMTFQNGTINRFEYCLTFL